MKRMMMNADQVVGTRCAGDVGGQRRVEIVGLSVAVQNPTERPRIYERAGMHLDQSSLLFERELRPGIEAQSGSVEK